MGGGEGRQTGFVRGQYPRKQAEEKGRVNSDSELPGLSNWETRRTKQKSQVRRSPCYLGRKKVKFEHTDFEGRVGYAVRNGQLAAGGIKTVLLEKESGNVPDR